MPISQLAVLLLSDRNVPSGHSVISAFNGSYRSVVTVQTSIDVQTRDTTENTDVNSEKKKSMSVDCTTCRMHMGDCILQ